MKPQGSYRTRLASLASVVAILVGWGPNRSSLANEAPVADAGLPRYTTAAPVQLNGNGSYDPDESGPLGYTWTQVSGPAVVITDDDTATPTISDLVQTDEIQQCEFELVVRDGELTSVPDAVKVIIVPTFTDSTIVLENETFDPQKPTIVFFDGAYSSSDLSRGGRLWDNALWEEKANVMSFVPYVVDPGSVPGWNTGMTFSRCADMIIVYLSANAPDYNQRIQTLGMSLGGVPAIDVALRLNKVYKDARYTVNHVSFLDATDCLAGGEYRARVADFLASSVDGEQCWLDCYDSAYGGSYPDVMNVRFETRQHGLAKKWYRESLAREDMNVFNSGVIAGAYWSVVGPGRNLQLASTPDVRTFLFAWHGDQFSGHMDFVAESSYPGRLPEPVTLVGPVDVGNPNGAILTCEESENAIGYQLLFGSNSCRVMDYAIVCDTATPPDEIITTLPFEKTWWTVRVYDEYGSTIYADPKPIGVVNLSFPIENMSTGKRYGYIQDAMDDAADGDEIILSEGSYHENIDFKGKNLTIRSTNPSEPAVVGATVISGSSHGPTVTFSDGDYASCLLHGFTIVSGTVGISCRDASPTIRNCTIESTGAIAVEFWEGYEPTIVDCTILGLVKEQDDPWLLAYWPLDEAQGVIAYDNVADHDGRLIGGPVWQPDDGMVAGALQFDGSDDYVSTDPVLSPADGPFTLLAWVKATAAGQTILSQVDGANWLCTDPASGYLLTELKGAGRDSGTLCSDAIISDGNWHQIALVCEGEARSLYWDDVLVAEDIQAGGPVDCSGGLNIGCGGDMAPTSFFSGLIDDVRVYNRAVRP